MQGGAQGLSCAWRRPPVIRYKPPDWYPDRKCPGSRWLPGDMPSLTQSSKKVTNFAKNFSFFCFFFLFRRSIYVKSFCPQGASPRQKRSHVPGAAAAPTDSNWAAGEPWENTKGRVGGAKPTKPETTKSARGWKPTATDLRNGPFSRASAYKARTRSPEKN